MAHSELARIGVRLLWIGGAFAGGAALAALGPAAWALVAALPWGKPVPAFAPRLPSVDVGGCLLLAAALTLGVAASGWQGSALRRVLLQRDASTRTDLFYVIPTMSGVWVLAGTAATFGITDSIDAIAKTSVGLRLFADLPLYLTAPAALFCLSFITYWIHRAEHTPLLWPIHAVHHSATDFNIIVTYRNHPAALIFRSITLLILTALGFPLDAITVAMTARHAYVLYLHSDMPGNAFAERWIAFGPRGHSLHHGGNPACFNTNYGDLVIWDRLFGTFKADRPANFAYGCDDPEGIYRSGRPLRDVIAVEKVWLRGLWHAARRLASIPDCA